MIHVKGHEIAVDNWSDVMDLKLRSLATNASSEVQDKLVLSVSLLIYPPGEPWALNKDNPQVFRTIMSKAYKMDTIAAEVSQYNHGDPKANKEVGQRMACDTNVDTLSKSLADEITRAGALNKIRRSGDPTPLWSLFSSTAWPIGSRKPQALRRICAIALDETEEALLEARKKMLRSTHTMDLRFSIWLEANLQLRTTPTALFGSSREFRWWDLCPDQLPGTEMLYEGDEAKGISALMYEDRAILKELGDFLTRSKAFANNRDSPGPERVISLEAKRAIDTLLEVCPDDPESMRDR